jgi:hypothetical protein
MVSGIEADDREEKAASLVLQARGNAAGKLPIPEQSRGKYASIAVDMNSRTYLYLILQGEALRMKKSDQNDQTRNCKGQRPRR